MIEKIVTFLKKIFPSRYSAPRVSETKNDQYEPTGQKQEELAGGFVYLYPYTDKGITYFTDNVRNAIRYAQNLDDDTASLLHSQVFDLDAKLHNESLQKRMKENIKTK